jgi:subtilase family serine protease
MKNSFYKIALGTATVSLLLAATMQSVSSAGGQQRRPTWGIEQTFTGAGPWQTDNNNATVNKVCSTVSTGASCDALVLGVDRTPGKNPFSGFGQNIAKQSAQAIPVTDYPDSLSPSQLINAYNFPTTTASGALPGTGKTIAIVDAYDDPSIASDLATFDTQFGIPQLNSCTISTTSGPCFQKVSETGTTVYPAFNQSWSQEISLDVEYAHAVAPGASILLVEATTNGLSDLMRAIGWAATKAQYVSMSFGAAEVSNEKTYDAGLAGNTASFFAAAGDVGLGAQWPAVSPKAISVGGTTLDLNTDGTVASETGWVNGGGGCSAYETASASQLSYPTYNQSGCAGMKATPDVAADADPNTGVLVYNSNVYAETVGWYDMGGTSLATPIWAARAADSGSLVNSAYVYGPNAINFKDITQGGNSAGCLVGYDLSTGLGSWNN